MSNLLINEPPLQVLPSLAVKIGLGEAIIVQQIHYWSQRAKVLDDGFAWVYNTIPEWNKQFPFWSERTIFSMLKKLREAGILIAERKSDNPWNQTLYYRLDYEKLDFPISQPLQDRTRKTCDITVNTETTREYLDRFDIFWKKYPRKVAKPNAQKAWLKIKPDDLLTQKMIAAIDNQGLCDREIQFVPHPASWLNAKRWEDEIQQKQASKDWWMNDRRIK